MDFSLKKNRLRRESSRSTEYMPINNPKQRMACWKKTLIITAIVIFSIALLLFLAAFVAFPIAFMESLTIERALTYFDFNDPSDPEFDNPRKYDIDGVINEYYTTKDYETNYTELVKIGMWIVKHISEQNSGENNAKNVIKNSKHPILLYFHGVACNRIRPIPTYNVLRQYFVIIGVDYRHYGDSGENVELTELGIVHDNMQIYEWVKSLTSQDIYIWGHSLGTAISTHTVRKLKEEKNLVPMGLVLEAPFTTFREEVYYNELGRFFQWLAYFNATFLDALDGNGIHFRTTTNIKYVDCPILIMHAEDDNIIPVFLGRRVARVASTERNITTQGGVTFHQFPSLGYGHNNIITDLHIPQYVDEFMNVCQKFSSKKRKDGNK